MRISMYLSFFLDWKKWTMCEYKSNVNFRLVICVLLKLVLRMSPHLLLPWTEKNQSPKLKVRYFDPCHLPFPVRIHLVEALFYVVTLCLIVSLDHGNLYFCLADLLTLVSDGKVRKKKLISHDNKLKDNYSVFAVC